MRFSGSLSEIDKEKTEYELVGLPFDGNASKKGARDAPTTIRKASQRLETFLWHRKLELSDLFYYDCGDIKLERFTKGGLEDFDEFELELELDLHLNIDRAKKKIFIGGDHSLSYPLVKYLFEHDEVVRVIVIDAHTDFRDSYKKNRFSNACVTRRIAELIGSENVIGIGARSSSEADYVSMKEKIRIYDSELVRDNDNFYIKRRLDEIWKNVEAEVEERTYLSIDIDVLDPGIAPGVEHPEPCGISLDTLLSLIQMIIETKNVVVSDVMEVNPRLDNVNGITSITAARIIFEILACYAKQSPPVSSYPP